MPRDRYAREMSINISADWFRRVVTLLGGFFVLSYVVRALGVEYYGAWAAVASLIDYLWIIDAGMSTAVQYHVARSSVGQEPQRMISIYSSAFVVYGLGSLVALGVLLVLSHFYGALFPRVGASAAAESSAALVWIAAAMPLHLLSMPVRGALIGLRRNYIQSAADVAAVTVRVGAVIVLFRAAGPSLRYLGVAFLLAAGVRLLVNVVGLGFAEPRLRVSVRSITRKSMRAIVGYSSHSLGWAACRTFIRATAPIVAVATIGPAAGTYFAVATRLSTAVGDFIMGMVSVFMPTVTALTASGQSARLRAVLLRGTRFASVLTFAGAAVLIVYGVPLVRLLVGNEIGASYSILVIAVIAMSGDWAFTVAQSVLMGLRLLWPVTSMMLVRVALSLAGGIVLARTHGAVGLAAGFLFPLLLTSLVWLPRRSAHAVGLGTWEYLRKTLPLPALLGAALAAVGIALRAAWPSGSIAVLGLEGAILLVTVGLLGVAFGFDPATRETIRERLRRVRR